MVRVARTLEAAVRSSAVAVVVARARREARALTAIDRVRLAGLLVLTALVTEQLLIRLIPAPLRPMPPAALRYEIALAAIVITVMARPIARAWPASRLRRLTLSMTSRS